MCKDIDKFAWLFIKDRQVLSAVSKGKDTCYIPGENVTLEKLMSKRLLEKSKKSSL
jgi:hypothetical protein